MISNSERAISPLVVAKKRQRPKARRRRAAHFSRKDAKNASFEERPKGKEKIKNKIKVKTLGEESPRPSLFFHQ
ncbi:MAG: hypothetical protein H7834_12535 [Magnetococcus sp. YQC-9]